MEVGTRVCWLGESQPVFGAIISLRDGPATGEWNGKPITEATYVQVRLDNGVEMGGITANIEREYHGETGNLLVTEEAYRAWADLSISP